MKIDFSEMRDHKKPKKDGRSVYRFSEMVAGDVIKIYGSKQEIDNALTSARAYEKRSRAQFVCTKMASRSGLLLRIKLFRRFAR